MATWAEDVTAHNVRKNFTAPPLAPMQRFVRKDGEGRRREDRGINIVTGQARSAAVMAATEAEKKAAVEHVTAAMNAELARTPHAYDIITMKPRYGVPEDVVASLGGNQEHRGKRVGRRDPFVNYDILTNTKKPELAHIPDNDRVHKPHANAAKRRETNILSHQFVTDHERRQKERDAAVHADVEARAMNGREFNPITQQYNDAQREMDARKHAKAADVAKREAVRTHTYDIAGIVKRSDGHAFDIVTGHVYNPDMVLKLDKDNSVGLLQRAALRQKWEYQRDIEEAVRETDVARVMNRVSQKRVAEVKDRGYDILTTRPFVEVDVPKSKTKPWLCEPTPKPASAVAVLAKSQEPRGPVSYDVLREEGPRSTYERVFNASANAGTVDVSSFHGRQRFLLPTLDKVKARAPDTGGAFTKA